MQYQGLCGVVVKFPMKLYCTTFSFIFTDKKITKQSAKNSFSTDRSESIAKKGKESNFSRNRNIYISLSLNSQIDDLFE